MGSTALTPEQALEHLAELSSDVRVAVLVDQGGAPAASFPPEGPVGERLGELTQGLLATADGAAGGRVGEVEVATPGGAVFVSRDHRWSLAVVAHRFALSSLMRYDLRRILVDLDASTR